MPRHSLGELRIRADLTEEVLTAGRGTNGKRPFQGLLLICAGATDWIVELTGRQVEMLLVMGCLEAAAVAATGNGNGQGGTATAGRKARSQCLVLTDLGATVLERYRHQNGSAVDAREVGTRVAAALGRMADRPLWKAKQGELWWRGELVERFRHDAADQRCVLDAFQDHAWENRIDDPLPVRWGRSRKKHLHETIKSLNRGQKLRRIRFRGDGTASGIRWEGVT
jgi:hypothetical protein